MSGPRPRQALRVLKIEQVRVDGDVVFVRFVDDSSVDLRAELKLHPEPVVDPKLDEIGALDGLVDNVDPGLLRRHQPNGIVAHRFFIAALQAGLVEREGRRVLSLRSSDPCTPRQESGRIWPILRAHLERHVVVPAMLVPTA